MPASAHAHADVVVTVTTRRYDQPNGTVIRERHSITSGPFDTAVLDVLTERLQPWALSQVYGPVLARRPAPGDPIEYLGWFSPVRQIAIAVRPVTETDALPPCKTHLLRKLFLDYSVQTDQLPVAA